MIINVPFNRPVNLPSHVEHFSSALGNGSFSHQLSSGGAFSKQAESLLAKTLGKPAILTTSATHSLEMMALLLNLRAGDEVVIPSFTFPSTANAFLLRGVTLRFADNDGYGNISSNSIERLLSPRTKVVVAVHYGGGSAHIESLAQLCKDHNVILLEDAAQAIGASYHNEPLGTFGLMSCFSFHDSKIITAGEGGALIINHSKIYDQALILRDKGTDRARFLTGQTHRYQWCNIGSSYGLSELNAMYLYPQIIELGAIIKRRKAIWFNYLKHLKNPLAKNGVEILEYPEHNKPNYHQFALLFRTEKQRNQYIQFMKERGISTPFHYVPLHTSPYGRKILHSSRKIQDLPGAERFGFQLVRLPIFYNLTENEQEQVIARTLTWASQMASHRASSR